MSVITLNFQLCSIFSLTLPPVIFVGEGDLIFHNQSVGINLSNHTKPMKSKADGWRAAGWAVVGFGLSVFNMVDTLEIFFLSLFPCLLDFICFFVQKIARISVVNQNLASMNEKGGNNEEEKDPCIRWKYACHI